jgi:hypothetical protein
MKDYGLKVLMPPRVLSGQGLDRPDALLQIRSVRLHEVEVGVLSVGC